LFRSFYVFGDTEKFLESLYADYPTVRLTISVSQNGVWLKPNP
jgi:hypothetical protein